MSISTGLRESAFRSGKTAHRKTPNRDERDTFSHSHSQFWGEEKKTACKYEHGVFRRSSIVKIRSRASPPIGKPWRRFWCVAMDSAAKAHKYTPNLHTLILGMSCILFIASFYSPTHSHPSFLATLQNSLPPLPSIYIMTAFVSWKWENFSYERESFSSGRRKSLIFFKLYIYM